MLDQAKKETLIVLIVAVVVSCALLFFIGYFGLQSVQFMNQIKTIKPDVANMKQQIEMNNIIDTTMAEPGSNDEAPKEIYKVEGIKLAPEDNFVKLIDDIVLVIRENQIAITKIGYEMDSSTNELQKANCSKMKLSMTMITTYSQLTKFVQQIADYKYLIEVDSMNIKGNRKNKEGLLEVSLVLSLYIQE